MTIRPPLVWIIPLGLGVPVGLVAGTALVVGYADRPLAVLGGLALLGASLWAASRIVRCTIRIDRGHLYVRDFFRTRTMGLAQIASITPHLVEDKALLRVWAPRIELVDGQVVVARSHAGYSASPGRPNKRVLRVVEELRRATSLS